MNNTNLDSVLDSAIEKIESLRNKMVKHISVDESYDQDGEVNLNIDVDFYEKPKEESNNNDETMCFSGAGNLFFDFKNKKINEEDNVMNGRDVLKALLNSKNNN